MESSLTYLYIASSALAFIGSLIVFLFRKYKSSLGKQTQTFRSFILGTIRLRIGALFSKVLASQLSARRYAEIALSRFPSKLTVPSMQHFQLDLDKAYVRLSVTTGDQSKIPDRELLYRSRGATSSSVLVLGEPGSGKSTLTKKLFREACIRLYGAPSQAPLPVHLELRSLPWHEQKESDSKPGEWLQSKISDEIDSVKGVHSVGFIFRAFSSGQGLVLFLDGLDEVPSNFLKLACLAISDGVKELAGLGAARMTVLVTGRSQLRTTLPRSFLEGFSDIATVESFSPADVFQFLQRWPFPSSRAAEASRVFRAIQSSPSLQEMCTNPLVLSMYVARDQLYVSRSGTRPVRLPDTRTDFYQEIVNELLLFRRGEQVAAAVVGSQLLRKRENALGRVALAHLLDKEQPANSVPWVLAARAVKEVFQLVDDDQVDNEIRRLATETGIFSEERPAETIRFLHLTLCEFLAAVELRESDPSELNDVALAVINNQQTRQSDRLAEVLLFAASLAGRARRAELINLLLATDNAPTDLLLRIIYENHETSGEVLSRASDRVVEMLRSDNQVGNADRSLHLLFLCILNARRGEVELSGTSVDEIEYLIGRIIDEEQVRTFDQIFDAYLSIDPDAAVGEATKRGLSRLLSPGRLVNALEDPDVVESAIAAFRLDPSVWGLALAEAALRYRLVAEMLLGVPPTSRGQRLAPRQSWANSSLLTNSMYGEVLSFASLALKESANRSDLPKLSLLEHYGADLILQGREYAIRQALNLAERRPLGIDFANVLFEVPKGRDIEVWGDPSIVSLGTVGARNVQEAQSDMKVLGFGPNGDPENIADYVSFMLAFDGVLTYLPNVTPSSSIRVAPLVWRSRSWARTLRLLGLSTRTGIHIYFH